jgi:hypothetical protein
MDNAYAQPSFSLIITTKPGIYLGLLEDILEPFYGIYTMGCREYVQKITKHKY